MDQPEKQVKWRNLIAEQKKLAQCGREVRLGHGRSLMVAPEFDAGHLRALLAVLESAS